MATPKSLPPLPVPTRASGERETLEEMLDYFRAVLARKAAGLDHAELTRTLAPSTLSLGGLLFHMALVEEWWFQQVLLGRPEQEPWASAPWDDDRDWEMTVSPSKTVDELWVQFKRSVDLARAGAAEVSDLDTLALRQSPEGVDVNLRWIYVHMIEEYARHCGHADFLRQAVDGTVGD